MWHINVSHQCDTETCQDNESDKLILLTMFHIFVKPAAISIVVPKWTYVVPDPIPEERQFLCMYGWYTCKAVVENFIIMQSL